MGSKNYQSQSPASPAKMEIEARVLHEQGKYRKARDIYKELLKTDRERYLEPLIACYAAQAQQLLAKNMADEAQQIYKQIEFLTGQTVQKPVLVSGAPQQSKAQNQILSLVDTVLLSNGDSPEKVRAADDLVLTFTECLPLLERDPRVHAHLICVFNSLQKISESRFDEALESSAGISISSPFAHWRLFIKGLTAYYAGDDQKAIAALNRIPGSSILSEAVESAIIIMNNAALPDNFHKNSARIKSLCAFAGHNSIGDVIARSEYLHVSGRKVDAYFNLHDKIKQFPQSDDPMMFDLAMLYFHLHGNLHSSDVMNFYDRLFERFQRVPVKNAFEDFLLQRTFLVAAGMDDDLASIVNNLVAVSARAFGKNFVHEAVLNKFAAADLINAAMSHGGRGIRKNAPVIQLFFERAIELDCTDIGVWNGLVEALHLANLKGKLKSVLGRMVKQFPGDLAVYKNVADRYFEQDDYVNAGKLYKDVLSANPSDSQSRERLLLSLFHLAFKYAKSRKAEPALKAIDEAIGLASNETGGQQGVFVNSRGYLLCRKSIVCRLLGKNDESARCLESAVAVVGELETALFVWYCARSVNAGNLFADLEQKATLLTDKNLQPSTVLIVWQMLAFWQGHSWLSKEINRLAPPTKKLIKGGMNASDARTLFLLLELFGFPATLELCGVLSANQRRNRPDDLFFRCVEMEIALQERGLKDTDKKKLQAIIKEAAEVNDQQIVRRARLALDSSEQAMPDFGNIFGGDHDGDMLPEEFFESTPDFMPPFPKGKNDKELLEQVMKELIEAQLNDWPPRPRGKRKPRSIESNNRRGKRTGSVKSEADQIDLF